MQLRLMKSKSNNDRTVRGHNRPVLYMKKIGFRKTVRELLASTPWYSHMNS